MPNISQLASLYVEMDSALQHSPCDAHRCITFMALGVSMVKNSFVVGRGVTTSQALAELCSNIYRI